MTNIVNSWKLSQGINYDDRLINLNKMLIKFIPKIYSYKVSKRDDNTGDLYIYMT
jgi:hypothetical protein